MRGLDHLEFTVQTLKNTSLFSEMRDNNAAQIALRHNYHYLHSQMNAMWARVNQLQSQLAIPVSIAGVAANTLPLATTPLEGGDGDVQTAFAAAVNR